MSVLYNLYLLFSYIFTLYITTELTTKLLLFLPPPLHAVSLHVYVPETHKRTFYEHRTFKQHVETFSWNEARHGVTTKGVNWIRRRGYGRCCRCGTQAFTFPRRSVRRSTRRTGGGGRRSNRSGSTRSSRRVCQGSCYQRKAGLLDRGCIHIKYC